MCLAQCQMIYKNCVILMLPKIQEVNSITFVFQMGKLKLKEVK